MKKVISILLSSLIVLSGLSFSAFATGYKPISASEALKQYEEETGEKVETNRYYFLMPDGTNGKKEDYYYPLSDGENAQLEVRTRSISSKNKEIVGQFTIYLSKRLLFSGNLYKL